MLRGRNRPHLYTWISITLITAVVAYLQFIGGAGLGAWPTIIGVMIDIIILAMCFRYGTDDIVFVDKICLGLTVLGVIFYVTFHNAAVFALVLLTIAEVVSFVPTFRKTRNDPWSESLPSYWLLLAKLAFVLIAVEQYNFLTVFYSAVWIAIIIWFLFMTYRWRIHHKKHASREILTPIV